MSETLDNTKLVFVSHCGEDTWVARQIAREIEARGAKTFLDDADVVVVKRRKCKGESPPVLLLKTKLGLTLSISLTQFQLLRLPRR